VRLGGTKAITPPSCQNCCSALESRSRFKFAAPALPEVWLRSQLQATLAQAAQRYDGNALQKLVDIMNDDTATAAAFLFPRIGLRALVVRG
jgi:hypothetical protein